MLRLAQGELGASTGSGVRRAATPSRPAIYAEDPARDHRPSAGLLTRRRVPRRRPRRHLGRDRHRGHHALRPDAGQGHRARRRPRRRRSARLADALAATRVDGIETNLGLLRAALADPDLRGGDALDGHARRRRRPRPAHRGARGGTLDHRAGLAGPHRLLAGRRPAVRPDGRPRPSGWATAALGNHGGRARPGVHAAGPGAALQPRHRRCASPALRHRSTVDGVAVPQWEPVDRARRQRCWTSARPTGTACARYVLVARRPRRAASSWAARPPSRSAGSADTAAARCARVTSCTAAAPPGRPGAPRAAPGFGYRAWEIGALEGPHAAPEFFTEDDIDDFYAADWKVHFNSARTGVRLVGPRPPLGPHGRRRGRAAPVQHPRHAVLGRRRRLHRRHADPARPGRAQSWAASSARRRSSPAALEARPAPARRHRALRAASPRTGSGARRAHRADGGVLGARDGPAVTYRRSGDDNLLVEYGPMQLDLALRMRVHALAEAVAESGLDGVIDLTPGIRSLQVQTDPRRLPQASCSRPVGGRADTPADRRAGGAQPHRPPAAVLGRPGDPGGHRPLHGRRARRRAVVPVEHRVHPPRQRPGHAWTTCTARSSTPSTWCSAWATSTWARRSPPRWTRGTGWSPPSTTRRAPGPRRTRSASAARTCASTAWRARAATSSSAARPRCGRAGSSAARSSRARPGCCASSTGSGGTRSRRRNCWTCAPTSTSGRFVPRIEEGTFSTRRAPAVPRRQRASRSPSSGPGRARRSPRSATPGRRRASSPGRTPGRARGGPPSR